MGERMAAFDWSRTPLGPAESWPQSLRTCVRIILTSSQPMFVWWGDGLINLYNDAYRSIVGGKHPGALGQPASSVWREIWDQVGPRAEASMQRNRGTYDEALLLIMERNGYAEETYYTFSYSPVPNDQGGAGGILCANTDDTARIIGERRITLLRELAARTGDARTCEDACRESAAALATNTLDLPFALLYLSDVDLSGSTLAGASGIERGHLAAPERLSLDDAGSPWPIARVMTTCTTQIVGNPGRALGPLPTGAWDKPPKDVVVLPIAAAGKTGRPAALVVGLNPYQKYDAGYRSFLELVARQIGAALGNAQAYEAEKKRAETLAELDRAKTAFFSNVSHEFRTPLTLMLGPVEDAIAAPAQALVGQNLSTVHRNALRLLKLVNTVLDFTRIEAGRAQARFEPTDVGALTRDLASAFRAAIERAGLAFDVDCTSIPEPLFLDRDMWEKIMLNLLSNAFKFTFEGSVTVRLRRAGDHVELTVADTGSGIPKHELPHLFERFHRVSGSRSRTHEGSGIGLALVNELVRLHGGTIRVASEEGRGTTFTIAVPTGNAHLPTEQIHASSAVASTALGAAPFVLEALRWLPDSGERGASIDEPSLAATSESVLEGGRTARILLADDNADMRDYVARVLRERWSVEVARNGGAALAAARRSPPDLVLTDVMMPELDGFGLLRALRADPETRGVPVIMLSARAGEESRIEGLEAGADDYLIKPFSARELVARVATHLQIARLRVAAERERRKLSELLMQAPMPVAVLAGSDLRFELANEPYCRMVGRSELVGKTFCEAFPELKDHVASTALDGVYATGEPLRMTELLVPLVRGGALSDAFFDYVAQPVRDEGGAPSGIMIVATEVTEQVLARHRVDSLRAQAETANLAKDEFLAMLGHELRNPLAPIVTALQLLRLRDHSGAGRKEREVIERQVNHLARLVDDLLDVSRIARGKMDLDRRPVELSAVVANAIEVASPLFEERRQHLDVHVPAGLPLDADEPRLMQVISNLLTNASKYTPRGGHVEVSGRRDGEDVELSVCDDGVGIAPDMLSRVFEMFSQERQSIDRAAGGLGLGLAIVKNLVKLHGGSVLARSDGPGRGSEFLVRMPAHDASVSTAARADASEARKTPVTTTHGRILIVDDNPDAAEMLREWVEGAGSEVRIAHDGPAALSIAEEFVPDILLLDIGLPVMDGYEVARRIRQHATLRGVKLVALTGYGQHTDRVRSAEAGFDAHLVKPVDLDTLDRVLGSLTGSSDSNISAGSSGA
jgi:signal transduction histidine kinase